MQDAHVSFRVNEAVVSALSDRARQAGCSVSEYLRILVREDIAAREPVSPICADLAEASFFKGEQSPHQLARAGIPLHPRQNRDPLDLIRIAGEGDTQAQRDLAEMAIMTALSGKPNVDPFLTLSEGLIFARLADRHDDPDDAMRIIIMLALASTISSGPAATDAAAEAIARLEMIADTDADVAEVAADLLANCGRWERRETMKLAKQYRDRLISKEIA